MIKKVSADEFVSNKKTITATKLNEADRLIYVDELKGSDTVLVSDRDRLLRFKNEEISLFRKSSVGVRGMKLEDDELLSQIFNFDSSVKCIVRIGNKRVNLSELRLKKRDQKPESMK